MKTGLERRPICFDSPPLATLSFHMSVRASVSPFMSHVQPSASNSIHAHRCPVGLVGLVLCIHPLVALMVDKLRQPFSPLTIRNFHTNKQTNRPINTRTKRNKKQTNTQLNKDVSTYKLHTLKRKKGREERTKQKQETRGHKIVADGWAVVSNPHPHPLHKKHLTLVFALFDSWTDGWMDGRTDKASYRVACPQLKKWA